MPSIRHSVAVTGIGHTDYAEDYRRVRSGAQDTDSYGYAARAFQRALDDAGVAKRVIDGLIVGPTTAYERMGEVLGINPRWGGQADAGTAVIQGVLAIACGMADTVALVYGNAQRSMRTAYGGPQAVGGDRFLSYVYFNPWGFTSQGALYAMMMRRHMEEHGTTSEQLSRVSVAQRSAAVLNPNAIMRKPITTDDYLAADLIAEPLRLFDYCLINDGGVSLILTRSDIARETAQTPILIAGIGRSEMNVQATTLHPRMIELYRPAQAAVAKQVYEMARVERGDIDSLQVYDSFSCHVPFALEGFGFCPIGKSGAFLEQGATELGGYLPVNTSGGHLSESYMQGWNHQIEAVRQLRHAAGDRQIADCRRVQYVSSVSGKVLSVIYERGA